MTQLHKYVGLNYGGEGGTGGGVIALMETAMIRDLIPSSNA